MEKNNYFSILYCCCFLLLTSVALAQNTQQYLVLFSDKANSTYNVATPRQFLSERAIQRRNRQSISITTQDLPVNISYLNAIKQTGAKVGFTSRWFNGALVEANDTQLQQILSLPYVKGIEGNTPLQKRNIANRATRQKAKFEAFDTAPDFGLAYMQNNMIGVDKMHEQGFRGEGMLIAILDAGYSSVNTLPVFSHLFNENKIVGTYDFVNNKSFVYEGSSHGTAVLSCLAAQQTSRLVGTAPNASYLLLRTEDTENESLLEEVNWLIAAEYADSLGVDLINSSLGYTEFDNPATNHQYKDFDGKTTIAARAAALAAAKGIICTISAGNEGNSDWKYISTPADADSVLSVGAVDAYQSYVVFTSIGPSADGRIKPDVAAMGQSVAVANAFGNYTTTSGTSFASPILCGMVAGFWQANPQMKAQEVIRVIQQSGSTYTKPTPQLGYGVPHFERAMQLAQPITFEGKFWAFPNPISNQIKIAIAQFDAQNSYSFELVNTLGQTVLSGSITHKLQTIPCENLQNGLYFLSIKDNTQQQVFKMIKD